MKITDILRGKRTLSFEIFPPKGTDDAALKGIYSTIAHLGRVRPDFISVTYAPAGRNRGRALEMAEFVKMAGMTGMCHFTAVGYRKSDVDAMLSDMKRLGIANVLALRGDIPPDLVFPHSPWEDFRYAKDLIAYIRSTSDVAIGAACYPECHSECRDRAKNLEHLAAKRDSGADFFITQLFFDNAQYFKFRDEAAGAGISNPIIPGIMPVLKAKSIQRIISLSGCSVPKRLSDLLSKYAEDDDSMAAAGVDWAAEQVDGLLLGGAPGIHLYTMNQPARSLEIVSKVYTDDWSKK